MTLPGAEAPFSHTLFDRLDRAVHALRGTGPACGWDPGRRDMLRGWLTMQWQALRASVSLLECAREELRRRPEPAPFGPLLDGYLARHALEEADHDAWLLEDLATLGVEGEAVRRELPSKELVAMVGSQYYLVRHHHPALLLGYLALCEGYPPDPATVERLRAASATPEGVWRTYRLHGTEDLEHRRDLCTILDAVPGDAVLRRAVVVNALRCAVHYRDAFVGMCRTTSTASAGAPAADDRSAPDRWPAPAGRRAPEPCAAGGAIR